MVIQEDSLFIRLSYDTLSRMIDSMPAIAMDTNYLTNGIRKIVNYKDKYKLFVNYENGVESGDTRAFDFKDQLLYHGHYVAGIKVGQWIHFYRSGQLEYYNIYDRTGGLAYYRRYYKDGTYKSDGDGIVQIDTLPDSYVTGRNSMTVRIIAATPPEPNVNVALMRSNDITSAFHKTEGCVNSQEENEFTCTIQDTDKFKTIQIQWSCLDSTNGRLEEQIYHIK